ncbi:hypothetical protein WI95_19845 [Burkholderia contaminans]|nr:hypothetical protein WI95_19845 [Burkholderia contaminans]
MQSLGGRGLPCFECFGFGGFKSDLKVEFFEKSVKGNEHCMLTVVTEALRASSQLRCFAEICACSDERESSGEELLPA